jgi:hypothetical protein
MTFNRKEYMKEYFQQNKERKREWDREYYLRNKEHRLQYTREWRLGNKEKLKIGQHKYYLKHRSKKSYFRKDCYFITRIPLKNLKNYYENDYWRKYCIKNKEHIQERHREWYLKNKESILHQQKMYRASK